MNIFKNKFSTETSFGEIDYRKEVLLPKVKQEYIEALSQVEAIADDIILRNLLNLIESTLRTNFYILNQIKKRLFLSKSILSKVTNANS